MDNAANLQKTEAVNRDGLWPMPPGPPHEERHFAQREVVRDIVIGAADGPVLPFALALGLAGAGAGASSIVAAGLVVATANGVRGALQGYFAARNEADHYAAERRREEEETVDYADRERWEVAAILHRYGVRGDALRLAVESICTDTRRWVDFMMRFELDLREPEPQHATRAAIATGLATALAGLVPLLPFISGGAAAPWLSVMLTGAALATFGWLRARAAGLPPLRGGLEALATGGLAAAVASLVARAASG